MAVRLWKRVRSLILLAAGASLAACAPHSGTTSLVPIQGQNATSIESVQFAAPPACKNQRSFSDHASDAETLLTTGGSLCIPAFGGFGGHIKYPAANPSVGITLISSTTNYTGTLPTLHSGTPIFYLQLATTSGTTFGSSVAAGGGLTAAKIVAGNKYTIYGQADIGGFTYGLNPCYTTATKGVYGGVIGGMGSLLKGLNVPAAATGVLEVFKGKSTTGAC